MKVDNFGLATLIPWRFQLFLFFFFFKKSLLSPIDYRRAPRLMFAVIGQSTFSQEIDSFNFATHSPRRAASFSLWKLVFLHPGWTHRVPRWIYRGHLSSSHLFSFFQLLWKVVEKYSCRDRKVSPWISRHFEHSTIYPRSVRCL